MCPIEIFEVTTKKDFAEFIRFPFDLYSKDPLYVPQLISEQKEHFSEKNPFFKHAKVKFFIAKKNKKTAGRVISIINQRHIEFQNEKAGFFGFFESINDKDVALALLDAVSKEHKTNGMEMIRGPMNFSTNDECGFMTQGFDESPMLMTPYNMPYYNDLMESCGMQKAKDLYAFIYETKDSISEKVHRVAAIAEKRGITVRPINKKKFGQEMTLFKEVYNSAWEKNWGFVPLTDSEIDYLGSKLKQIAIPELTLVAEDKGSPVGFLGLLPDFNYVLKKMHGKINPLTIAKALYYSRKIKDLRLLLLGIKAEYRNKGVDAVLILKGFEEIKRKKHKRVEFSWILEDNIPVIRIVEMIGGKLYKKYRIYEKIL